MSQNPLFPANDQSDPHQTNFALPKNQNQISPLTDEEKASIGANPAADLIREKLDRIYAKEPDALAEEREAEIVKPRSRHQQFMYELSKSGRSLAEIQVAWHEYYTNLPNDQKHEVWQEFYANNQAQPAMPKHHEPTPHRAREVVTEHFEQQKDERRVVTGAEK